MYNCLKLIFFITSVIVCHIEAQAQYQLILTNGRRVIHRFSPGESLHTKWRNDKTEHWGFIISVNEFTIVTSQDTIEISKIDRVLLPGKPVINYVGKTLVTAGLAYMLIDQFNWVVVQRNDPSMDDSVWKPASLLVGVGVPMLFFKKKWSKIKRGTHLVSVNRKSKFYLNE